MFILILLWSSSFHVLISAKSVMLTISMEQSHCWVANSRSAGQISRLLWNLKIDYRVHNSPPLLSVINSFLYVWMFLLLCNMLVSTYLPCSILNAAIAYTKTPRGEMFYFCSWKLGQNYYLLKEAVRMGYIWIKWNWNLVLVKRYTAGQRNYTPVSAGS